jgi:hypothetical protein
MPTSPRAPWIRVAALSCSFGLAAFVIVHAQFGCDAPATTATPSEPSGEPALEPAPEPASPSPNPAPNASPAPSPDPNPDPDPSPAPNPDQVAEPEPEPEPVFMPASKSGGDYGAMRFPGEPSQQAPR